MSTAKEKRQQAKDSLRPHLVKVQKAQEALQEALQEASPEIAALIKVTEENGPHKIRLDPETVGFFTFRKKGDFMHAGKAHPLYDVKASDLDSDE